MIDYDREKVAEVVLALMYLTLHDHSEWGGARAWKSFDWDTTDLLFERGWIGDPKGKAKSVTLSPEGVAESERLFVKYFGASNSPATTR